MADFKVGDRVEIARVEWAGESVAGVQWDETEITHVTPGWLYLEQVGWWSLKKMTPIRLKRVEVHS